MDMIQQPLGNINSPVKKKKHLVKEAPGVYSHVDQHGHKTYYVRYKHCGRAYWEKAGDTLTAAKRALTVHTNEGQRLDAVERLCSGSKGEYGVNGNEAALTERLLTLVG